jgi:hypothetical protein
MKLSAVSLFPSNTWGSAPMRRKSPCPLAAAGPAGFAGGFPPGPAGPPGLPGLPPPRPPGDGGLFPSGGPPHEVPRKLVLTGASVCVLDMLM